MNLRLYNERKKMAASEGQRLYHSNRSYSQPMNSTIPLDTMKGIVISETMYSHTDTLPDSKQYAQDKDLSFVA